MTSTNGKTRKVSSKVRRRHESKPRSSPGFVVAGLFAGVGGIELGLSSAGHHTKLLCENDLQALNVLINRFPGVKIHRDIKSLKRLPPRTQLIAAGFPCQDLSQVGTTVGLTGPRSGLVRHVFRLARRHRTPVVLLENVPFMLRLSNGEAIQTIATTFEKLGYKWAYRVVDTRAFGLPQRRRRVYFLASRKLDPRTVLFADNAKPRRNLNRASKHVACGFYWTEGLRGLGWAVDAVPTLKGGSALGIASPPAVVMSNGHVVTPNIIDAERMQGLPRGWTGVTGRNKKSGIRWRLVGNAVSVPASRWIGRRLRRPGRILNLAVTKINPGDSWPNAAWNVGDGRFAVQASEWPVRYVYRSLHRFLKHTPQPLSVKATNGFLKRAKRAKLKFPKKLLPALRAHVRTRKLRADRG